MEIVIENLTLYTLVDIVFTRLFNHTIKKEIIGNSPVKEGGECKGEGQKTIWKRLIKPNLSLLKEVRILNYNGYLI